jgi:hypothetical protein
VSVVGLALGADVTSVRNLTWASARPGLRVESTGSTITDENSGGRFMSYRVDRSTMPAISITDDQRERLRRLQARLEDDVEYGHVRPRDAVEYLLDRLVEDDPTFEAGSRPIGPAASDADSTPERTREPNPDEGSAPGPNPRVVNAPGGGTEFVVRNGEHDGGDATEEEVDAGCGDSGAPTGGAVEEGDAGSDDETRLNAVMRLLDDHDEKWREAGSGEEKYEVDLPDGSTGRARTKDDVRALLFEHYR